MDTRNRARKPIRDQYQRGSRIGAWDAAHGRRPRPFKLASKGPFAACEVKYFIHGYRAGYAQEGVRV